MFSFLKTQDESKCHYNTSTGCVKGFCTGFVDVESGNETALQVASATIGPISVAIDASHASFQLYKDGERSDRGSLAHVHTATRGTTTDAHMMKS